MLSRDLAGAVPTGDEPVLELVVVQSTRGAWQLSLRCPDNLADGGLVTARLNVAGFQVGDRVELRRKAVR
jgi:hypothetical protein